VRPAGWRLFGHRSKAHPVIWVDDNRVLLHNTWLYNLSNREGKDIRPADADYIWTAALNNDHTLLAMAGKTSSSPMRIAVDGNLEIIGRRDIDSNL